MPSSKRSGSRSPLTGSSSCTVRASASCAMRSTAGTRAWWPHWLQTLSSARKRSATKRRPQAGHASVPAGATGRMSGPGAVIRRSGACRRAVTAVTTSIPSRTRPMWSPAPPFRTPSSVAPAPNATLSTRVPGWSLPVASASAKASGTDAAPVFPSRSTLMTKRSSEMPPRFATASMIRWLAWWGMTTSMSSIVHPAASHSSEHSSVICSTAMRNVPLPARRSASPVSGYSSDGP